MILLYSPKITNRLEFVAAFLFGRILGVEWKCTSSEEEFVAHDGPGINYSTAEPERDGVRIAPHGFLLERGVHFVYPGIAYGTGKVPLLFPVEGEGNDLPFDPFAATFYLLSRYEEYLPHTRDQFGRFEARESFAFKNGFLQTPVADHYAAMLREKLVEAYPRYPFPERKFTFVPTYDIDVAYAYRGRSLFRNVLGILRSMGEMDVRSLLERLRVLSGARKDPFDTYDLQIDLIRRSGIKPYYFFLMGDYGPFDKNLAFFSRTLYRLIKMLGDYACIGIHPSYASVRENGMLRREMDRLAGILNQEIVYSRQHYLKLDIPDTYQRLLKHNVQQDFTMGYATHPGFRAGTCTPFPFYDLETEKTTPLIITPLAIMDGTLRDYLGVTPPEAVAMARNLMEEVNTVKGSFVTLWHNDALCDCHRWSGWKDAYLQIFDEALSRHQEERTKTS